MAGEILRQRREELGLNLREISDTLRIKYSYLKALEDGDMKNLPPEVYVKGYIHEYARVLNMDPNPVISSYMELMEKLEPDQSMSAMDKKQLINRKKVYILLPALLVLAVIFFTYLQQPSTTKKTEHAIPASTPEASKPEIQPTQAAGRVPQNVTGGHLLQINAHDTTWLQVMIDKDDLKELLMKPGDSVEWRAEESFSLKIGNAGGVTLRLDGKELTNLGETGQVVKMNLPESGT